MVNIFLTMLRSAECGLYGADLSEVRSHLKMSDESAPDGTRPQSKKPGFFPKLPTVTKYLPKTRFLPTHPSNTKQLPTAKTVNSCFTYSMRMARLELART